MINKLSWLCLVAACLSLPVPGYASDTNYQDYILGSRAVGLGGAYTAIASDPSATWYNPAGLPDVRRASVDISTNLYGFNSGSSQLASDEKGLGESVELSFSDINIIPASLGVAKGLGERREDGVFNHAIAFSLLIPSLEVSSLVEERQGQCLGGNGQSEFHIQRSINDRTLWTGLGYGSRINDWLSIGASVFYVLRSFERFDDAANACSPQERGAVDRFTGSSTRLRFSNGNLMGVFGAKITLSPRMTLGIAVGSPSIHFNSEGELSSLLSGTHPSNSSGNSTRNPNLPPEPFFESPTSTASRSETQIPIMIRTGFAYIVPKKMTAAFDITYHGPTEYELFQTEEGDNEALLTILSNVTRNQVINLSAGLEYLFVDEVSASVGMYTNFSSAPEIEKTPISDQLPMVDMLGLTGALGYFTDHSLVRAGLLYSFGSGHDVLPANVASGSNDTDQPQFQRVDISRKYLYFFVASTFRY